MNPQQAADFMQALRDLGASIPTGLSGSSLVKEFGPSDLVAGDLTYPSAVTGIEAYAPTASLTITAGGVTWRVEAGSARTVHLAASVTTVTVVGSGDWRVAGYA